MGLVNDQVLPGKLLQRLAFLVGNLIGRDANVPSSWIIGIVIEELPVLIHNLPVGTPAIMRGGGIGETIVNHVLAFFSTSVKLDDAQHGAPSFQFIHPVGKSGLWDGDQMGALNAPKFIKVSQDANGLKRFAETLREVGIERAK
jgi:hypothetical protein